MSGTTRVSTSWSEQGSKVIAVEGAVTIDTTCQHAFEAVANVNLMPKLYPATANVKVLSQELEATGGQVVTMLEQEQVIQFLKYFSGTFTSTVKAVADSSSHLVQFEVVESTLMEFGQVSITVKLHQDEAGGEDAEAAPEGSEDQEASDVLADTDATDTRDVASNGNGAGAPKKHKHQCIVHYQAKMKLKMLPPLHSWRQKVYQMQCNEVGDMLRNLADMLASAVAA